MKVQDITPSYLKGLQDQGIDPGTDDAIAMRVQDVTPEYVRDIQALGFKPSANEIIAMRVQDVTPEYIKALQSAGFKLSVNDIISAKVQDVTPEFIDEARKHGFKDLTLQKLIQLRQLGDPGFQSRPVIVRNEPCGDGRLARPSLGEAEALRESKLAS